MTRIGRRDQLVTLERYTTSQDSYGEDQQDWAPIGQEWAAVFYGRGDERRQAAMEQGSQAATFKLLSNTLTRSLTLTDRIVHEGANWDIQQIAPMERGYIEITAVRAA